MAKKKGNALCLSQISKDGATANKKRQMDIECIVYVPNQPPEILTTKDMKEQQQQQQQSVKANQKKAYQDLKEIVTGSPKNFKEVK